MAKHVDIPSAEELLRAVDVLLRTYEPSAMTFLDACGAWRKNPTTTIQRISCELWFRVWERRPTLNLAETPAPDLENLFLPLVESETCWALALVLSRLPSVREQGGESGAAGSVPERPGPPGLVLPPAQQEGDGADARRPEFLLVAAGALYRLIEHAAYRSIADSYAAEWDRRGKSTKTLYSGKLELLTRDVREAAGEERIAAAYEPMAQRMREESPDAFAVVSSIIAEEERTRTELVALLSELKVTHEKEEVCELISAHVCPHPSMSRREPRALLRPCVELLSDDSVDVASGVQYRASAFLGSLGDVRAAEGLLEALKSSNPAHSFLRANLVYALGNLREKRAIPDLTAILEGPDRVRVPSADGSSYYEQPLDAEKREAIWALGKLGVEAAPALPALMKYSVGAGREAAVYLAWTVGRIGAEQRSASGSVDATIPIILMRLLASKDSAVFEEAYFALRDVGLSDVLQAVHLRDFTTVPILSLKPSSTGLYELSETILHLVSVKRPVVMAVTGDSGTGKTYFCRTIAGGFGGIDASEILYMMRDGPENKTFDRILGLRWLRSHNEPRFYEHYPVAEDEDNPEAFFDEFLRQHSGKKLIILDGWRDEPYFHQVVRRFYERDHLDVLVRFQTTFSTRRINLENREGTLERVRLHLPLVETPAIEETRFYQEGAVLIYGLDNSIQSRLEAAEIQEVFERVKVDTWGDQIRIGKFARGSRPLEVSFAELEFYRGQCEPETVPLARGTPAVLAPAEESFSRMLNDSPLLDPNLLQSVSLRGVDVNRIAFFNHGQIACCGYEGRVGVMTGFNDRIFHAGVHEGKVTGVTVVSGEVFSVGEAGDLRLTSFHRNTSSLMAECDSPVLSMAPFGEDGVVTGHTDGTVRIWRPRADNVTLLRGHKGAVLAVTADRKGRVFSGGEDGELREWDIGSNMVNVFRGHGAAIRAIDVHVDGRVVTGADGAAAQEGSGGQPVVRIVSPRDGACEVFGAGARGDLRSLNVYYDGRVLAALSLGEGETSKGSLVVLDPRPGFVCYSLLRGHEAETRDCVSMGPRIVTCGSDAAGRNELRIWGTATYVEVERNKLKLMPDSMVKPPYYRSLF